MAKTLPSQSAWNESAAMPSAQSCAWWCRRGAITWYVGCWLRWVSRHGKLMEFESSLDSGLVVGLVIV